MELAPQYYLGNLPPSEGKELLMELRQSQASPDEDQEEGSDGAYGRTHKERNPNNMGETHSQYSTELCIVQ